MTKFKKRKEEQMQQKNSSVNTKTVTNASQNSKTINIVSEKFSKIFKKKKKLLPASQRKDENQLLTFSDENSVPSSPVSAHSDNDDGKIANEFGNEIFQESRDEFVRCPNQLNVYEKYKRKSNRPCKNRGIIEASLIDKEFWSEIKTCCGIVYENQMISAVLLVDSNLDSKCMHHNQNNTVFNYANGSDIVMKDGLSKLDNIKAANAETPKIFTDFSVSAKPKPMRHQGSLSKKIDIDSLTTIQKTEPLKVFQHTDLSSTEHEKAILYSKTKADFEMPDNTQRIKRNGKNKMEVPTRTGAMTNGESAPSNYLHKFKFDSNKLVKPSIHKVTPAKFKSADLNLVKNFVKMCAEKSAKVTFSEKTGGINDGLGCKFNENSSDSGYEEILQEPHQVCKYETKIHHILYLQLFFFF